MKVKGKRGSYKEAKSIQHKKRQTVLIKLDRIIELLERQSSIVTYEQKEDKREASL